MKNLSPRITPALAWRSLLKRTQLTLGAFALSSLAANAGVALTFDTTTQGFSAGGDASTLTWVNDPTFGGCLKLVIVNDAAGNQGYKPNSAYIDIYAAGNEDLRAEFAAAANLGGTFKFTMHVRTADFVGTTPGYTPGYFGMGYLLNAQSGYTVDFPTYIGGYVPGGTISTTVQVPIAAVGSGGGVGNNSTLEYFAASTYNQLSLGVNTSKHDDGFLGETVYIDNVTVTANTVASPPPTLSLTEAIPGLNQINSGGGQYDRQAIRTVGGLDTSWVGKATPSNPVSYEWTIKDIPNVVGYESFMYLIPGSGLGVGESAADYSQPDGIQLLIYTNGDAGGSGSMSIRYKVNSPGSNGPSGREYYVGDTLGDGIGGQITFVYGTKVVGTWKCTFTSNTAFTLTAPDGNTSSGVLHPDVVDDFTGPMYVYFGNIPSQVANVGLATVYSRAKVSGIPVPLDENFAADPMTPNLEVCASVPASVVLITSDLAKFWINWTLPAPGYLLYQSTDLGSADPWQQLPFAGVKPIKTGRKMLLPLGSVLSESLDFFRMEKVTP